MVFGFAIVKLEMMQRPLKIAHGWRGEGMKHYGRYIPNLLDKNLQQLHDMLVGMHFQMDSHFINGSEHPISVKQQFFIMDLMANKKKEGEVVTCKDADCIFC